MAQVAADEPDTAAKIAQPMMFVWSSRPGRRSIQGASPRNMSSESRVRNRISPIQMKSGSAVRVQLDDEPQIVTAIASPTGRVVKSSMPTNATPTSARPIQTPVPSRRKSAAMSSPVIAKSLIRRARAPHPPLPAPHRRAGRATSASTNAMNRITVPAAIASCGIQSGVASFAVEMSLNAFDCQASRTL